MMHILLDSNVVYDYLAKRHPHYDYAVTLLSLGLQGRVRIYLCATTISNGVYIFRHSDPQHLQHRFAQLLDRFTVLPLTAEVLAAGLQSNFADKEDAFIHFSARLHESAITHLVTRNATDFAVSDLEVVSPLAMIDLLTLPSAD